MKLSALVPSWQKKINLGFSSCHKDSKTQSVQKENKSKVQNNCT
jgi:hypothetical protein